MGIRREPTFMLFGYGIDRYTWRGVAWFMVAYFAAFAIAAVLGVLYHWTIHSIPAPADGDSLLAYLQSKPLAKHVDRIRMLGVAVSLVIMIRWCGLPGRFGFNWSRNGLRLLSRFFLLGLGSLGMVVLGQVLVLDYLVPDPVTPLLLLEVVVAAVVSGLLLGWIEEAVFRGMLFRMFYTATRPLPAIILCALLYAAVHFKTVPDAVGHPVHWYSGFLVAGYQSVSVFLTVDPLEFLNLFLVGIILTLVFMRTGNLCSSMGLHAGWVAVRNGINDLVLIPEGAATRFWGTERIVDGYACLIILAILTVGLYAEYRAHLKTRQIGLGNLA